MQSFVTPIRQRLDRAGIALSALCAVHCVLSVLLVSVIGLGAGLGAEALLDPAIHRFGLLIATLVAAVAIGWGAMKHRMAAPFVVAMMGLSFMGGALAVSHGAEEAVLTIIGVALVSLGHILNLRHLHTSCTHGADH
ncbi:MAG: MerC domain-containing protein [Qipengyuania sp.]|nr:MerC domain-containing protein [Qipengyuania sp.]